MKVFWLFLQCYVLCYELTSLQRNGSCKLLHCCWNKGSFDRQGKMKRETYEVACTAFIFVKVHYKSWQKQKKFTTNGHAQVSEDMKLIFILKWSLIWSTSLFKNHPFTKVHSTYNITMNNYDWPASVLLTLLEVYCYSTLQDYLHNIIRKYEDIKF